MESTNRKVSQYNIHDEYEAGIMLTGAEVKSIRAKGIDLSNSFVYLDKNGEAWLTNAVVQKLIQTSTHEVFETTRSRKLLLSKRELSKIIGKVSVVGWTCIPKKVYFKGNKLKCAIAVVSGKKEYDKRHDIKERESKLEINRAMTKRQKRDF